MCSYILYNLLADGIFFYIVHCSLQTLPTAECQQQIYMKNNIEIFVATRAHTHTHRAAERKRNIV